MVYQYTKPRRPVMASFSGPGPCYAMPGLTGDRMKHDPRSAHLKGPAYTIASRSYQPWSEDIGPGPAYDTRPKSSHTGCTMVGRPRTPKHAFQTPGPGAYNWEKRETMSSYRAPTFHFGLKNKGSKLERRPG